VGLIYKNPAGGMLKETQRYAHLAPENAQGAVKTIEKVFRNKKSRGKSKTV